MTDGMPRPHLPYLQSEFARDGKTRVYYVRLSRKSPRIRIRAEYGSDAFKAQYRAAVLGEPLPVAAPAETPAPEQQGPAQGSMRWAVGLYMQSSAWMKLAQATRRQRANIFKHVLDTGGNLTLAKITDAKIRAGYEKRSATPAAARNYMETMRGLFKWAVKDAKLVTADPTIGVTVARLKSDGFLMWSDADIAAYEKRWPRGTRERVAFDVLLYTGLRRGDAVVLGRQHVKNGIARIKTEKGDVDVTIPLAPELLKTLDAGPCGDLTFIAGERSGKGRVKESFGEWFRAATTAAGLVRKSAHGLRKAAATRAAMNGASERELNAMFGWTDGKMAAYYTKLADNERLALGAAEKLHRRNDL